MKPLLPLAASLAVTIAGCSKPAPYAKYRDVQLKRGMKIADIKQRFGEPDSFDEWWSKNLDVDKHYEEYADQQSPTYPRHVQELNLLLSRKVT